MRWSARSRRSRATTTRCSCSRIRPTRHNRARALFQLKRFPEALRDCERALALQPDHDEALRQRSRLLLQLDHFEAALVSIDKLLETNPEDAKALQLRALSLRESGQFEASLTTIDRALALAPDTYDFLLTRGLLLKAMLRLDEALVCFDRTVEKRPEEPAGHSNRGMVLADLGQFEAARAAYDQALTLAPDFVQARWNRALMHLLLGNFTQGWQDYESRWDFEALNTFREKRDFDVPLWRGCESLEGKTILLHAEQGLGDTLQFCRYAPLVAARGARVILEVQPALAALVASLPGVAQVVAKGDPLPPFDFHCPLLSLPLACGTDEASIPAPGAYLRADGARCAEWAVRLGEKGRPRVGLVWSGNPGHRMDRYRSIACNMLKPLLLDGFEFVSLQKEVRPLDRLALQMDGVRQFGEYLRDFSDTAAPVEQMDVVVTVDTSVAHLAGALGKPVWILLAGGTLVDWRWQMGREDSPRYPGARLYRQEVPGEWAPVLAGWRRTSPHSSGRRGERPAPPGRTAIG
ncbi:tetratricopeptide repeat protein [Massilia sp. Se16.2.3]|uniref:tetratricopeptide repeat protein n=1 Tax=Massilia sp. Se16.2.3 TaxID=2709303 RepID=UPI0015FFEB33|nr:tetratricopeptide repeat protein [Massilia sp. Se16.2.3]QNA99126.1 tetratricopeptide repeat protein [Massilia sp. Se16.2.3]